jgi:beta-xylosidase
VLGRVFLLLAVLAVLATVLVGAPEPLGAVPVAGPVGTYRNPVFGSDFPDPYIYDDHGTYVAYATNAYGPNIQVVTSPDLHTWSLHHDALPSLPSWAEPGKTWAPSVAKAGNGYVLYYTARHHQLGINCIGAAFGTSSIGPFHDFSAVPIMCQGGYQHGSIDPSPILDAFGRPWLIWKSEGTRGKEPTRIWSRPMRFDGLGFDGPAFELAHTDQSWEGPIIENPSMVKIDGKLFLFYSGGHWEDSSYAINYAQCAGLGGPCVKVPGPWVHSTGAVAGPGGQDFFHTENGGLWMSYHGWSPDRVGYPNGARTLRIDRVGMSNGRPVLFGPTHTSVPF